jgi:uncharacterized membrane protein (UPF0136 family)
MIGTIAAIAYGILALVGGIIGYIQVKSKMSLISGVISGVLLIVGGMAQLQGMTWGSTLAAIVTAVLIVVFVMRLTKTRKFMPAGLMAIAGVFALSALLADTFL